MTPEEVIRKLENGGYGAKFPSVPLKYDRREYGTKKAAVLAAIAKHPEAGPTAIAKMCGCVPGYVCNIKAEVTL